MKLVLKLHQIFLLNFIILLSILLAFVFGVSYFSAKSIDSSAVEKYLPKSLELACELLAKDEKQNLDAFAKNIKKVTELRVTIIDENGTVLAETDKDKQAMENHLLRVEIMQAMRERMGSSVRRSTSTGLDYIYFAKKISVNGGTLFLRVAHKTSDTPSLVSSFWTKIATIFLLALVVGVYISYKMNLRIQEQIEQITVYLSEIENKNFKAQLFPGVAKEFFVIAAMLRILSMELEKKEKQKRKYTAKLKLKNRQTNDVIEAISHEFKNPVAAIMGYAETLLEDPAIDILIMQKFLEKIYSNSKAISTMIDRLSLSIKLENNVLSPQIEPFDIYELSCDVSSVLLSKYKNRNIEVQGGKTVVSADKTMMKLILINLADNALKYSNSVVFINIKDEEDSVKVEIIDSGAGIPASEIENITKKFYRINKNSWDNSLGIGLSLVSYILKLHATELEIHSKVALGSTFSFSLPKNG